MLHKVKKWGSMKKVSTASSTVTEEQGSQRTHDNQTMHHRHIQPVQTTLLCRALVTTLPLPSSCYNTSSHEPINAFV